LVDANASSGGFATWVTKKTGKSGDRAWEGVLRVGFREFDPKFTWVGAHGNVGKNRLRRQGPRLLLKSKLIIIF